MVPIYMGIVKMGLGSTLRSVLFWTSTVDVFVRMIPIVAVKKNKGNGHQMLAKINNT